MLRGPKLKNTTFGAFCSVGPESIIGGLGKHPTHFISTHPSFYSNLDQAGLTFTNQSRYAEFSQTTIENDVWIGTRAIVLDGIKIGNGAIIAAGAIVTKDVDPYAIVGGVPARLIKYRFLPETIDFLNRWEWWNLPTEILIKLAPRFTSRESWTVSDVKNIKEMAEDLTV